MYDVIEKIRRRRRNEYAATVRFRGNRRGREWYSAATAWLVRRGQSPNRVIAAARYLGPSRRARCRNLAQPYTLPRPVVAPWIVITLYSSKDYSCDVALGIMNAFVLRREKTRSRTVKQVGIVTCDFDTWHGVGRSFIFIVQVPSSRSSGQKVRHHPQPALVNTPVWRLRGEVSVVGLGDALSRWTDSGRERDRGTWAKRETSLRFRSGDGIGGATAERSDKFAPYGAADNERDRPPPPPTKPPPTTTGHNRHENCVYRVARREYYVGAPHECCIKIVRAGISHGGCHAAVRTAPLAVSVQIIIFYV